MAKIMIVDDNVDIVETLKDIMELEGHETELTYSGEEFLETVETVYPDLVLLDVMMPGLKTKEILFMLKEKKLDVMKIIVITVVQFSQEQKDLLMAEYNIVDFISKPFDVLVLINKVRSALQ